MNPKHFEVTLHDRLCDTPVWKKVVVSVPFVFSGGPIDTDLRCLASYISDLTDESRYQDDHGRLYEDTDFDKGYGRTLGMGRIEPTNLPADLVLVHYEGYGLAAEDTSKCVLEQLHPQYPT